MRERGTRGRGDLHFPVSPPPCLFPFHAHHHLRFTGHMTALPSRLDDSASWSPVHVYYGGKPPVKENAMTKKEALRGADD